MAGVSFPSRATGSPGGNAREGADELAPPVSAQRLRRLQELEADREARRLALEWGADLIVKGRRRG